MSDKHTGYRADLYHAASDEAYQRNHAIDPRTGQPVQQWQQGQYGQQAAHGYPANYYQAGEHAYGDQAEEVAAHQRYYQGGEAQYVDERSAYYQAQHGYTQAEREEAAYAQAQAEQHGYAGYGQQGEAYAQHAEAEGYYDPRAYASQHEAEQYAAQHAGHGYDQQHYQDHEAYQNHAYYSQAQIDTGQAPALYGGHEALAQANAGAYGAYGQGYEGYEPQGYDYSQYGQQAAYQQGMQHLNDPFAPTPMHQIQADGYRQEELSSASGRKSFLVGAMILGSVIVGGGVATAYKYSGNGTDGDRAPVILSDGGDVKVAPDEPGGKEIDNQNKKIFARLGDKGVITATDDGVADKLRGEIKETGSVDKKELASADEAGGPRLVKTYKFNRNGEQIVDESAIVTTGQDVKDIAGVDVDTGKPPVAVKTLRAGSVRKEEEQQVASLDRGSISSDGNYVVQISARRSQQDALAAFSGLQDKYGDVLSGYRPLIQRADLGDKGVFYRLRVGPMKDKESASSVCSQLKSKGLSSCFVTDR